MARGALVTILLAGTTPASAVTEMHWWHAMTGGNNEVIVKLANEFNAAQSDYKLVPTYKGSYPDTLNAGIAAFRAGNAPHILQVFEVGTATMMAATGAVKPVHVLMKEAGEKFDPDAYLAAVAGYYSTSKGEMLSLPFNSSSTVMWLNKDAFRKAGLDPETPPKTWPEVFEAAKKLKADGYPTCGFSNAWVTWVNVEQLSAWHNVRSLPKRTVSTASTRCSISTARCTSSISKSHSVTKGQDLRLFGPHQHRRRPLHLRRVPDLPHLVGVLRQRQPQRQIPMAERPDAVLCRR